MKRAVFLGFLKALFYLGPLAISLQAYPLFAQAQPDPRLQQQQTLPPGQSTQANAPVQGSLGFAPTNVNDPSANTSLIVQTVDQRAEPSDKSILEQNVRKLDRLNPGEFGSYVERVLGRRLAIFGADLILPENRDFAVPATATVPPDYRLNVGDTVEISLSGSVDGSVARTIDTNGQIFLPSVGTVRLAGVRHGDLKEYLMRAIGTQYRNFRVGARVSALRGIRVYVTGYASNPGAYTVSSLSSLANAVFQAGGPSSGGSMRSIKLIRDGREIGEFDLYELILGGSRLNDFVLENEDVLLIPAVGRQLAVFGSVNKEAIFELREKETIADAVRFAGGISNLGDPTRVLLYRADPSSAAGPQQISMLDAKGMLAVQGDIIQALAQGSLTQPTVRQSIIVRIEGEVERPGNYFISPGTPMLEVIKLAGGLTSRAFPYGTQLVRNSVRVQQRESFNSAIDQVELALISQSLTTDGSISPARQEQQLSAARTFLANLRKAEPNGRLVLPIGPADNALPENLLLENDDRIYIPPPPSSVGVFGAVYRPASFMISDRPRRIRDYLGLAGGPIEAADRGHIFVVRANGEVLSKKRGALSVVALPGDVVFVPIKTRSTDLLAKIGQITRVLFELGIAAATTLAAIR